MSYTDESLQTQLNETTDEAKLCRIFTAISEALDDFNSRLETREKDFQFEKTRVEKYTKYKKLVREKLSQVLSKVEDI